MSSDRIALYGGSFDPPHLGHVLSVAWALSAAPIDAVWVIPTWKHAFEKKIAASYEDRFHMCEVAFSELSGAEVIDVERRIGGVSRTLQTIEALASENPNASFRLLIGADVLPTTDRWHRWDDVAEAAPPIVVGREGYPLPTDCPIAIPDINSTEIRARVSNGEPLDGIVPLAVQTRIAERALYREES